MNYSSISDGDYDDCGIWSPTCASNPIAFGDTVFINHMVELTADTDISGVLVINPGGTLLGNFKMKIKHSGTLINLGTINIMEEIHIDGSFFNSNYAYFESVHNDGYICNSDTVEIDPSATFDMHGGTLECGGLFIACDIKFHIKDGSIPHLQNQNLCCTDGSIPTIEPGPVVLDSATVVFCNLAFEVYAGSDNSDAICNSTGSYIDLNNLLIGADPGGIWTEISSSGTFDPLTGMFLTGGLPSGTYTFNYIMLGVPPAGDTATFIIVVEQEVFAGSDNSASICNIHGSSLDLNLLLAGADPSGVWQENTSSGAFDNSSGILNTDGLAAGIYTFSYLVTGILPCSDDLSEFTVNIEQEVFAGADSSISVCNYTSSIVDLNSLLNGADPGGVWTETSNSGAFDTNTALLNTDGLIAGIYTFSYLILANTPCSNDISTFTVQIQNEVFAGNDGSISVCNLSGSTVDLNDLLIGADPGGIWLENTNSGVFTVTSGVLNTDGLAAGIYSFTYIVTSVLPCTNDSAEFYITVEEEVYAGVNIVLSTCNIAGPSINLSSQLNGAQSGGVWTEITNSGAFDPLTGTFNINGATAGNYQLQYTLTAAAPCLNDMAQLNLIVEEEVFAGNDDSIAICNSTGSSVDLNSLLSGADAGGNWNETTSSGNFDPILGILITDGLTAGNYHFTYNVTGFAPCLNDLSEFTVTVQQEAIAGVNSAINLCNSLGSLVNLNTLLSGNNQVGIWTENTSSGQFNQNSGIFDVSGLSAGNYSFFYTIIAEAPCVLDIAEFNINIEEDLNAGPDSTILICNTTGNLIDLNALLNGANSGGIWVENTSSGQFNPSTGEFNASGLGAGSYNFTYHLNAISPCNDDWADITVHIKPIAIAGSDNTITICNNTGNTVDLNSLLLGNNGIGDWEESTQSGQFNPNSGEFDASGINPDIYTFNYIVNGVPPCLNDTAEFAIIVIQEAIAGSDATYSICNNPGNSVDLNTLLNGNNLGGTWNETTSSGQFNSNTGIFDVANLTAGIYSFEFSVLGTFPCPNDIAAFTITVYSKPYIDAGPDQFVCEDDSIMVNASGTAGIINFLWTNGLSNGLIFSPTLGTTSYSVIAIDTNDCTNTDTLIIEVYLSPQAQFEANEVIGCFPFEVTFTNLTSTETQDCHWIFGDGNSSTGCSEVSNIYTESGSFNVELTVTSADGCSNTLSAIGLIDVSPYPVASFTYQPDEINLLNTEVEFDNSSSSSNSFTWNFGDNTQEESSTNPTHIFPEAGNTSYTVTLIAYNDAGCSDTAQARVEVEDIAVFYVPNAFTPDGTYPNNIFVPVFINGLEVYDYELTVFNRWGEIIFSSQETYSGWDGTFIDGAMVESGVYIWQIEFKEQTSDKEHSQSGHISVIY